MGNLTTLQRVGIVLSVLWAFGAAVHQHANDVERANNFGSYAYNDCVDSKNLSNDTDLASCDEDKAASVATFMVGDIGSMAFLALAPLPFFWIAAYVTLAILRSLSIGLPVVIPWGRISRKRKAFVIICVVFTVAETLYFTVSLMNFYTDSKVPVALASTSMVSNINENTVIAEGTWTREGPLGEGSKMGWPLQTSQITCVKSEGVCTESRAYVANTLLSVDQTIYDIESWSPTTIVFSNVMPCWRETFTIDRKTQAVNGVGQRTQSNAKLCNMRAHGEYEDRWQYHLDSGFKTYWEYRQKQRPALLRVIQAMFGN